MPHPDLAYQRRATRLAILAYHRYRRDLARRYDTYDFADLICAGERDHIGRLWRRADRLHQADIAREPRQRGLE